METVSYAGRGISPWGRPCLAYSWRFNERKNMNESYIERLRVLHEVLLGLQVTNGRGSRLDPATGFNRLLQLTLDARKKHSAIFLVGNGASASMASHIAADLCKNADLNTEVFSDFSLLTAVANDVGSDHLYAVPLKRRAKANDILVAISSSGKSRNILESVRMGRKMGVKVITFSAMSINNPLRKTGDLNFYIRAGSYGLAESAHAVLLHYWVDMLSR
ncbi:MAG: SIS domain-containing protein [Kiritimatiellae bacterium]|nr:SIS domain-containing protein [Verrucomicrobiota bacterium]MBU4291501.1 SIS domain-containing protein [Verrucomicrobiota bacterium]MCG2678666.1 SIS domain-containing protein [Kiritimatiellia bacterium]